MSHVGIPMQDQPSSPPPSGAGRNRRSTIAVLAVLTALLLATVLAGSLLLRQLRPEPFDDYTGAGTGSAIVTVAPGDSTTAIANTLAEADVVASPQAFLEAAKGDPRATTISPGNYDMLVQMSGIAALERILDPAARYESRVVLPEGLRIDQTVRRTSDGLGIPVDELWQVLRDPGSGLQLPEWAPASGDLRAEGFLFPATYEIDKDAAALTAMQTFVDRFNTAAETAGLANAQDAVGYSPYEVLIIASLIQAEGAPQDYEKVARVIYNRLNPRTWGDTNGLLQLDATINYANEESKINLSDQQLQADGPYNTYTRVGLPPTPINSPGDAAIQAALNPADGNWLYYVTVNPDSGETRFSNSYSEFLTNKAEFQAWCKANSGKC